jgi:hypothetical protein
VALSDTHRRNGKIHREPAAPRQPQASRSNQAIHASTVWALPRRRNPKTLPPPSGEGKAEVEAAFTRLPGSGIPSQAPTFCVRNSSTVSGRCSSRNVAISSSSRRICSQVRLMSGSPAASAARASAV